nr:RING finger domain-containing protein [Candidatus Njordarchaeota archaeon]
MRDAPRFVIADVRVVGKWDWTVKMKCMVCNLDLKRDQEVLRCPRCGNLAHKVHILEWLHTHNYCPVCNQHLSESTLEEFAIGEM